MTRLLKRTRNVHITFNYPKFSYVKQSDNEIHLQSLEMLQLIATNEYCIAFHPAALHTTPKILSNFAFKGDKKSVRNETSCIERLNYKIHLSFYEYS